MIRINLLPFRAARKKENVRRQISVFLLSFAFLFVVVVYYNINLNRQINQHKVRNEETTAQLAKYNKINREIAAIKKNLTILNQKIDVINNLDGSRTEAVMLLESMTRLIVSDRMWFTSFTLKGNKISVKGIAMDERTIADFMKNLEGSYANVTLKSMQRKTIKGKNVNLKDFSFEMAKIQPQKAADKKPEKS
ncbi:MAG: pilus assembly protein PilN [Deltaproteobacteria bacterium]|nr:PilN domain-containing protein [Deltaproteobacteria bacterium]RLB97973.1 MAG: pilus assembly protein PilN [Deltaproteobacteria bacterium]